MILDRIRLQLKLNRERTIRQLNAEQYLAEVMDTEIKWLREDLSRKARLPHFEFSEVVGKMKADGLIELKQDGPPRHYQPYYSLTNLGKQRARHTSPRS